MSTGRADVLAVSRGRTGLPGPVSSRNSFDSNRVEDESFGGNVSRMKHLFQVELKKAVPDNRNMYSRGGVRSPEQRRKRGPSEGSEVSNSSQSKSRSHSPDGAIPDPASLDPQKFFETTNHVQRFQYTRAIFAKMEEQNRIEQERQRTFQRRTSPNRGRTMSPTSPPPTSPGGRFNRNLSPTSYETKRRSSSDPSKKKKVPTATLR